LKPVHLFLVLKSGYDRLGKQEKQFVRWLIATLVVLMVAVVLEFTRYSFNAPTVGILALVILFIGIKRSKIDFDRR
jgi:uncharacterized Tic20 family protein